MANILLYFNILTNIITWQGLEEKLKHVEAERTSLSSALEEVRNTSMDSNTQVEKMTAEVKEKSNEISGLQGSIFPFVCFFTQPPCTG